MAKELLHTVNAAVIAVTDSSYGGGERDGKPVPFVERYGLWVSPAFDQEPIGPLMCTRPEDLVVVRGPEPRRSIHDPAEISLDAYDPVMVNVLARAEVDRFGTPFLKYAAPRGEYPVFAADPANGEVAPSRRRNTRKAEPELVASSNGSGH